MNGHLVKPSCESSSLGRGERIMERVPMGERMKISTSPRLVELRVMTAWTCSR